MAAPRKTEIVDPRIAAVQQDHRASWVPVFLARASLGLSSVAVVTVEADGQGSVALVSTAEASAWLKARGDARGAAKVVGTATPGTAWRIGITDAGVSVGSMSMTSVLTAG